MHSKIKSVRCWLSRKAEGIDKGRMLYTAFLTPTAVQLRLFEPMPPAIRFGPRQARSCRMSTPRSSAFPRLLL